MSLPRKFRAFFRKEKLDAEMAEEMRAHLELLAAENERRGLRADEARYAAQRSFGGVEQIKERARDERGWRWLEQFRQDLRYAARVLGRNPGFTSVAMLTLGLGVGLNTAIFGLLNHFLLQPPRVGEVETVVSVFGKDRRSPANSWAKTRATSPYVDYAYYRDHNTVFTGLAAAMLAPVTMEAASEAGGDATVTREEQQIYVQVVSGNYFDVLRGRAALGRTFLPDEDRVPGAQPVVVLSHRFWQRAFASDPRVVGRTMKLNGQAFTIVGVAAAEFGGNRFTEPAVWVPMMMASQIKPGADLAASTGTYVDIVGRLKPGVDVAQAQAQMDVVAQQNLAARPDSKILGVRVTQLASGNDDDAPVWGLVLALVGMLLLIVSANVANLSLARSVSRQREIGVRLTLGASRGRLIRQLLTESALLGLLGGVVGLLLASATTRLLFVFVQQQVGRSPLIDLFPEVVVRPDLRVFGFALAASLFTGVVVGLAPALQSTNLELNAALKDEGSVFGRRVSRSRLRHLLVIVQVACCLVLLVGAGLLARGLQRAQSVDLGLELKRVLVVREDLRAHGYNSARRTEFYRGFAERVAQVPGVKSVALAVDVPLQGGSNTGPASATAAERGRQVAFNFVSPEFFPTLGIPLLAGRNFRADEVTQATPVAIVNEALARALWAGESPVGKLLYGFFKTPAEVVGVVRNAGGTQLWAANEPAMYFLDRPGLHGAWGSNDGNMAILVRTEGNPRRVVADVRDAMRSLDGELWPTIRTLEGNLELQLAPSRVGAWLSAALGLLALAVTSIGLYGVIAYATSQRTREIGVRMALGARPADIVWLVLGQGWRLVGTGMLIGGIGAVALGRVLAKFLYGLSPLDPVAFGGVAAFLGAVALLASWLPARRAAKVDPMIALRCE